MKGSQLVDVCLMWCGRDVPVVKSWLGLVLKFLGATFTTLDIVSCGGVSVDVLEVLEKFYARRVGYHYPYTIHILQIEKLLRKPSYCVMGRIGVPALAQSLLLPIVDPFVFKGI